MPVAVSLTDQGFDDAVGTMTKYRRIIRRPNADNESLKVIFNDYMNCLWGHPTAEEEFPLIDAAAEAGCEYFVLMPAGMQMVIGGMQLVTGERAKNAFRTVYVKLPIIFAVRE